MQTGSIVRVFREAHICCKRAIPVVPLTTAESVPKQGTTSAALRFEWRLCRNTGGTVELMLHPVFQDGAFIFYRRNFYGKRNIKGRRC